MFGTARRLSVAIIPEGKHMWREKQLEKQGTMNSSYTYTPARNRRRPDTEMKRMVPSVFSESISTSANKALSFPHVSLQSSLPLFIIILATRTTENNQESKEI